MPYHQKNQTLCRYACFPAALLLASASLTAQSPDISASVQKQLPALTETYKLLHRNPELSHYEEKTSAYLAGELRKAG